METYHIYIYIYCFFCHATTRPWGMAPKANIISYNASLKDGCSWRASMDRIRCVRVHGQLEMQRDPQKGSGDL